MTQSNTLGVSLSNSQLNKLRPRTKNGTQVTLKLSLNMVGDLTDETNFPYKLLINDPQFSNICKTFKNGPSASIKKLNCLE